MLRVASDTLYQIKLLLFNIFFFDLSTVLFVEGSFGRISELLLKGDWANCFIDCCWLLIFHRLKATCSNLSGTIMWMACLIKLVLNVVIIIVARDNGGNWTKLSSKKVSSHKNGTICTISVSISVATKFFDDIVGKTLQKISYSLGNCINCPLQ